MRRELAPRHGGLELADGFLVEWRERLRRRCDRVSDSRQRRSGSKRCGDADEVAAAELGHVFLLKWKPLRAPADSTILSAKGQPHSAQLDRTFTSI
jgi:hypothetical protein